MIDQRRDDIAPPTDTTELPAHLTVGHSAATARATEAPAVANVGRKLYTINSNRSRFQIIADYAAAHDLTAQQVDELVRQLPDYGVKSMLHASLVVLPRDNVVSLADRRRRVS